MSFTINRAKQRFIFLVGIAAIYTALLTWLNFLQGPYWADEFAFWQTSLGFSDRLIPTIDSLRDYNELSTPLPFVIYGILEHLFGQGIAAGRLLNIILSISIVCIIGWPRRDGHKGRLLCAVGLLICPYYLLLSGRFYTEMIACAFGILGFASYVRNRHLLSCLAFILAIASRQYMLAFPVAIVAYEFSASLIRLVSVRQFNFKQALKSNWPWIAPTLSALSIFGWIYLFNGLAPETATAIRNTPEIQKTAWAFSPGVGVNFLALMGAYIVIPEFILFQPLAKLKSIKSNWRHIALIALGCLLLLLLVPPVISTRGGLAQLTSLLPSAGLKMVLLYCLVLFACIRFRKPTLLSFIILFNSLMMIKADPWDKYVLPVVVIFWYLKSIGLEERFGSLFSNTTQDRLPQ